VENHEADRESRAPGPLQITAGITSETDRQNAERTALVGLPARLDYRHDFENGPAQERHLTMSDPVLPSITWTNERRRLGDLVPWELNPRLILKDQAARLLQSLKDFGQIHAIAIGPQNQIYDGHQRDAVWAASNEYGPTYEVDVRVSSRPLTDKERAKLVVFLHKGTAGDWDWDGLANLPDVDVADLKEWGFSDEELTGSGSFEPPAGTATDPGDSTDRAAELNQKWGVKTGDLWRIGNHRLLCGDSRQPANVQRVLAGKRAALCVTSPPYGVGKDYEQHGVEIWRGLISEVVPNITANCDVCVWNIADLFCTGGQAMEHTFGESVLFFKAAGWNLVWLRIWKKPGVVCDTAPYWTVSYKPADEYEFIAGFGPPSIKFVERLSDEERREWRMHGVWEISSVHANDVHCAMFPEEIPARAIRIHTDTGATVFEPFCGGGTTIIAAEKLNRRCDAIEQDANYCGAILERLSTAFPGIIIERLEGPLSA